MAITNEGIAAKKSGFLTRVIQNANAVAEAVSNLEELYNEGMLLGYGTSIQDADFLGDNNHIDRATLLALLTPNSGTAAAINTVLGANNSAHWKILLAFKRG